MKNDLGGSTRPSRFGTRDLLTTYGRGRTCVVADCRTLLSQYNDEDCCGLHASDGSGRRPAG